ncbi:MAG: hypothetical protein ABIH38_04665 [Patescibacteria group bacterium]
MDNQYWYYTLSAIAQVCGALVAIGGAVIVFKLFNIEKELNDFRSRVVKALLSPITGKTETQFYYLEDDLIVIQYEINKDKIISNGIVDEKVITAIRNNYYVDYRVERGAKYWVRGTISSFISILNGRSNSLRYFRQLLFLLITSIILNLIILAILAPGLYGAYALYLFTLFYSIVSIVISSYLSYEILILRIFNFLSLSKSQRKIVE